MLIDEFISNIEKSYEGNYSEIDIADISRFVSENNLNQTQLYNLYNTIKHRYMQQRLPRCGHIVDFWEQIKGQSSGDGVMHPQSPQQQIHKHKHLSPEEIIKRCQYIRQQQNERELQSWEISFITAWERLQDVAPELQGEAKKLIIAGESLSTLRPENCTTKESPDREKKTQPVSKIMADIGY